jgi:N-acetylmuramoyl-L-alanine amidase
MKPALLIFPLLFSVLTSLAQGSFAGRTAGQLPYLEYGWGDDRLGGAKLTYLDTGVLLRVVDSTNTDYRVQLSSRHAAFIPKQYLRRNDSMRLQPAYLTASWRVWGDAQADYVSVGLPERLPYSSQQGTDPSRIIVDIYGAVSNTNWITQLKTVQGISRVWYEQVEDDLFRVFIQLKHRQHWGHSIGYRGNALVVTVKRPPQKLRVKGLRIAIDAGHGGANTGARGLNTGILEKDYTLKMAQELQRYLEKKGAQVYMTRSHDTDITMNGRVLQLEAARPDLLISIHLNSASNKAVKGVSTYYRYVGFRPLTEAVLDRMLELGLNNFGNIGAFNFSLSGPTSYPNCLVEVAFLSNAEDEVLIQDPAFHRNVAKKIYQGINDWLKRVRKEE